MSNPADAPPDVVRRNVRLLHDALTEAVRYLDGEGAWALVDRARQAARGWSEVKLDGLFTCRTSDWDFMETVLWTFLRNLSAVSGSGDETGLGRQVCWRTTQEFPNQFTGINFSSKKHEMGHALMNQLSTAEKILPLAQEHDDIAQDFFSMRKIFSGGKWHFTEGRNNLNPNSHCDMAWAGALASKADEGADQASGGYQPVESLRPENRRKGQGL